MVIGLSEILLEELEDLRAREPAVADELAARAAAIRTAAEHMSTLVGQLLDTVAWKAGRCASAARTSTWGGWRRRTARARRPSRSRCTSTWTGPAWRDVDPDCAWEILDNLMSNALKFSPRERQVWVRTRRGAGGVRVEVKDEGPGLTAGESSTGLGLSIVKTLVELHGGTIAVESEPGAGARFLVDLPER